MGDALPRESMKLVRFCDMFTQRPAQIWLRKQTIKKLKKLWHAVHTLDSSTKIKDKEAHIHQAAPLKSHSFWPDSIPGTAYACPDYSQPDKTIQYSLHKDRFFKIGRDNYFI